jgi:hypothetical protein
MYGVTIQIIDIPLCIPPEDDQRVRPKYIVDKKSLLTLDSSVNPIQKIENTAIAIRRTDHVTPSIRKSWH